MITGNNMNNISKALLILTFHYVNVDDICFV